MLSSIALVLALQASSGVAPTQSSETTAQQLLTGDQKLLQPGYLIGNIAIGDPRVCDYKVMPGRKAVLLTGNGDGHTTLTIWDQQGVKRDEVSIDVLSRALLQLREDLTKLLVPYPAVQVTTLGARLTLTGTVDTLEQKTEVDRIAAAAGVAALETIRVTKPSEDAKPEVRPTPRIAPPPPPVVRVIAPPAVVPPPPGTATPVPLVAPAPSPAGPGPTPLSAPAPVSGAVGVTTTPLAPTTPAVAVKSVDYMLELIAAPASAPPPDVLGPVGTSVFKTKLSVPVGGMVRQFISTAAQTGGRGAAPAAQLAGLSLRLLPTIETDGRVRSTIVVDTNLPIGARTAGDRPQWRRGLLELVSTSGQSLYLTERDLNAAFSREPSAQTAELAGRLAAVGAAPNDGDAAVSAVGAIFRRGANADADRRGDDSVLVIVLTPTASREGRP